MASEVMKVIFAVLDVSFNIGHYTVIIKRQFLYINMRIQYEQITGQKSWTMTYDIRYIFVY